ncbi:MAG: amino-acid N-acetyltransferase [Porticoccaceae bacterium]|jgi:amino-acid N-acetyltransferase|nr:amino-acid N-acetyltransferase [Porticoccaceae bacterium]MBT5577494.1 amino-acid N-acetyltransferase [Porticoccaceae bacterium]MBT7374450.1 amino-acid N-acetyltransferase [Porticoccaceae bacterium]
MNTNGYLEFFRQTSPYIHAHRGKTFVIALGGDAVAHANFHSIVHDIALLQSLGIRLVLVHGARPQTNGRLSQAGLQSKFHDQLRITDSEAMLCVKEAVGSTRLHIESELSMGLPNSPMHGARIRVIGGNFITAKPVGVRDGIDFQLTGEVRRIDAIAIQQQLVDGSLVLLSPVGFSPTGEAFNLNFQNVAAEVAISLKAEKLILVSEAPGILEKGELLRNLSLPEVKALLTECKHSEEQQLLVSAYRACTHGVDRVHLVGCAEDGALLSELFTRDGSGTLIMKDHSEVIRPATIDDVAGIINLISPLEEQQVLVKRSRELLENEIARFKVVVHPEGLLLGCAALYPTADNRVGELACVATHPEFHGQGIASRLFDSIAADAKNIGMERLFVLTTQTAHWFLEKGFVEAAVTDLPEQRQSLYNYQRNSRIFSRAL